MIALKISCLLGLAIFAVAGCAGDEPSPFVAEPPSEIALDEVPQDWSGEFTVSDVGRVQVAGKYANSGVDQDAHNCVQLEVRRLDLISLDMTATWTPNATEPEILGYTFLKDADGPFRNHNDTSGQSSLRLRLAYGENESADWLTVGFHPAPTAPVTAGSTSNIQVKILLTYRGNGEPVAEIEDCHYDPNPLR